jgi:hypothetical protein
MSRVKWILVASLSGAIVVGLSLNGMAIELAVNGGFETGDFSDWTQFPQTGIQAITTVNPSSGTYAANLNVPVRSQTDPPVDNVLKNANLGAGTLTPGMPITVTWDLRGSLEGAGGVVFVELFSELTGGGTSKAEIYTGGPLFPQADWQSFTWDTTLGPDVSGGVTLQLKASCGPVEGCGVDAYFDNASITIPGPDPSADFNDDDDVDGVDFLIWQRGFGLSGQVDNSHGDADFNGTVAAADLAIWETQYGNPPPFAATLAIVPEPSIAVLLIGLSAIGILARPR